MPGIANLGQIVDGVWLDGVAGWPVWTARVRRTLLKLGGVQIGRSGVLRHQRFASGHRVTIGDGCFVNVGCLFEAAAPISIGNDVHVGPGSSFITSVHRLGPSSRRAGLNDPRRIDVEDGVWIGAGATIMPGVTVGRGCIVAAGAVLTHDAEADGLYAGVPARRLHDLIGAGEG